MHTTFQAIVAIWTGIGVIMYAITMLDGHPEGWSIKQFILATFTCGPVAWAVGIVIGAISLYIWLWKKLA